jgi:hypothetical protein
MDSLNIHGLHRNPDIIKKYLKTTNNVVTTSEDISILFPEYYISSKLSIITETVKVIGVIAILDEHDNYAVINIPIYLNIMPYDIEDVDIDGISYKSCKFNQGDVVMADNRAMKDGEVLFSILNLFYMNGKVPWYISYEDASDFIVTSKVYTGSNIGNNILPLEILASIISYDRKNSEFFYRLGKHTAAPIYKGLNNQFHAFDNTTSKLVGAYFSDGVITSLVDESKETTNIEEIIRG